MLSQDQSERFERAVTRALVIARTRTRVTGGPYVAHLFAVCAIVLDNGGSEDEAIAALLHDVPPADFGRDVARIARGCSDPAGAPGDGAWYDRTAAYVERVRALGDGDDAVRFVGAAIELDRARALSDRLALDATAFACLPGKKFGTLWAFRALVDAYGAYDGRHARFIAEVRALVDEMAGKPVTTLELLAAFLVDDTVPEGDKGALRANVSA